MKMNSFYVAPEAEQFMIHFEENILSGEGDVNPGGNEDGGDDPDGPSF
ncbi:MAG: hypothetical protein J6P46_01680 [Bacteroidales bacterium]|jgi:hypothetical protein|nr:hypothetical protein [Bacteroidales bacterium]